MTQSPLRRKISVSGVTARLGSKPPIPEGAVGKIIVQTAEGRRDSVTIGDSYTGKPIAFQAIIETADVPLIRDHQLRWKVRHVRRSYWLIRYAGIETRDTIGPLRRFRNENHLGDTYAEQRPVGLWSYGVPVEGDVISDEDYYSKLYERLHGAVKRRK